MIPFVILLSVPIVIQHVQIKGLNYQKKNKFALFFFFALLTLLIMFRHESVGNDTRNYMYFFDNFCRMSWKDLGNSGFELGFSYLNKIISVFSDNPHFYIAMAGVIISGLIYPTYKRLCIDASLTIVLFCTISTFVMMFSGIRQMMAIGIGFIAYDFTRRKKKIPFALCVAFAMTIHVSAFILAFMYPIYHAKVTKKWLYVVVPVLAIIFTFNKQIFSFLSFFLEQYTKYDGSIVSTGAYTMIILFTAFTMFSYVIPDEVLLDEETKGMRNFLLFALTIQLFAPLHYLVMRMNYYYIIFIPLLLPNIIRCRCERWKQIAMFGRHVMVAFFMVYFFTNAYSGGKLNVFPYHFFWENI